MGALRPPLSLFRRLPPCYVLSSTLGNAIKGYDMLNQGSVTSNMSMVKKSNSPIQQTLPIDIFIIEILPKLPAICLARLKCLNKFFKTLISSQEFITDHLRHSFSSDTNRLLIFCTAHCHGVQGLYSLDLDSTLSPARYIPLPEPFSGHSNYFDVVGCYNGLLCIRSPSFPDYRGWMDFMLLNPSTGIVKSDVPANFQPYYASRSVCTQFGFGHDDCKIVMVGYLYYHHEGKILRSTQVYSMKNNSWRCNPEVKQFPLKSMGSWRRLPTNGVLVHDNLLHWLIMSSNDGESAGIVCFNLETESWVDDLPLPDFDDDIFGLTQCLNLGVFDGSLCLSTKNGLWPIDVWVMKEYGVKESWTKLIIAAPSCEYIPLFAKGTKDKELLLCKDWPCRLGVDSCVWYNLRDQKTRLLEFTGAASYFKVLSVTVGSLVDLNGGRQIMELKQAKSKMKVAKLNRNSASY